MTPFVPIVTDRCRLFKEGTGRGATIGGRSRGSSAWGGRFPCRDGPSPALRAPSPGGRGYEWPGHSARQDRSKATIIGGRSDETSVCAACIARDGRSEKRAVTPRDDRPLVALTMGDVAGVGPEVIARAWGDSPLRALARPFVIGSRPVLERALACVGVLASVEPIARPEDAHPSSRVIPLLEATEVDVASIPPGQVDPRAGRAAYDFLITAIDLALAGRIDALTTLPLHKEALHAAGIVHPGHTEILAERCGVTDHAMMLYVGPPVGANDAGLGVLHVTLHVALRRALDLITEEAVEVEDPPRRPGAPAPDGGPGPARRGRRPQPARGRRGPLRRRGGPGHRPGDRARTGRRDRRGRADRRRHALRARHRGRVRRGDRHVSRPGPRRPEDGRLRPRRQRDARPADRPDERGARDRLRHRLAGPRRDVEPDRGGPGRRQARLGPPPFGPIRRPRPDPPLLRPPSVRPRGPHPAVGTRIRAGTAG